MAALAWGLFLYATDRLTVYWNPGGNSHIYSSLHPALYVVAAVSAVYGLALGTRSIRSPGQRPRRFLAAALLVLVAPTVWACVSTLLGRAYVTQPAASSRGHHPLRSRPRCGMTGRA